MHIFDTIASLIDPLIFLEKYLRPLVVDTCESRKSDKTYPLPRANIVTKRMTANDCLDTLEGYSIQNLKSLLEE